MSKISCEVCCDLMPLVKDEVASNDSIKLVNEHIKSCKSCKELYGSEMKFDDSDEKTILKVKKYITHICILLITFGILFGISLSANQFMFYNILIMPLIGAVSFFTLKKKSIYVCIGVFISVYLRWFYDSFGYALDGEITHALVAPLWWSVIHLGLTAFGVLIGMLLHFGFKKEEKNEKNS